MQDIEIKRVGKAIGGGELFHVMRGTTLIGTVKNISVGWISQRSGADFTFHNDKNAAVTALV